MKTWKKLTALVLALYMAAGILATPNMNVFAKATLSSNNITIITNQAYNTNVNITYSKDDKYIKNIKSSSKNLLVKQTYQYYSEGYSNNSATLEFFAKKNGNYKVTFDVYNKNNKKENSFTVKVKAIKSSASPVKTATFDGKSSYFYNVTSKKSGKFKVTMNKGYKLKKITMRYYDKNGKWKEKKIKNNAKVTLSNYAWKYEDVNNSNDYWTYYYSASKFATTTFEIEYQNTKTKETGTTSFSIYKLPK